MKRETFSVPTAAKAGARRSGLGVALVAAVVGLCLPGEAAVRIWTGGAIYNRWSYSANWDTGVPQSGDSVVFPGNLATTCTNNITGLSLAQILFAGPGAGWVIRGNPITLTDSISDDHTGGGGNTVELDITMAVPSRVLPVNVESSGCTLTLGGVLSGSNTGLTKTGAGKLVLGGSSPNTYSRVTTLSEGSLTLDKSTGPAAPSGLIVGDGTGTDTVTCLHNDQIGGNVTIKSSGQLNLNGNSDTIGSLTMQGGSIDTAAGTLTLGGDVTSSTALATLSGNLDLGGAGRTFTVADVAAGGDLLIYANISAGPASPSVAIHKLGAGQLYLTGNNSFAGEIVVDEGEFTAGSNTALGTTAGGTTVNSNACLVLYNSPTIGAEHLVLNSTYSSGALMSYGSASVFEGDIELQTNVVIAAYADLTLSGVISGPGGFTKIGAGTLTLAGGSNNSYAGTTRVHEGNLVLSQAVPFTFPPMPRIAVPGELVVGDGTGTDIVRFNLRNQLTAGSPLTVLSSGFFDLNGYNQTIGPLTMQGGIVTNYGTGTLTLNGDVVVNTAQAVIMGNLNLGAATRLFTVADDAPAWDLVIPANISGGPASPAVAIRKQGGGQVFLGGSNTFAGDFVVDEGEVTAASNTALGDTTGGTTVNGSASLVLDYGVSIGAEHLVLNSTCTAGALKAYGGPDAFAGNIELQTNVIIGAYTDLTLSGVISGPGGITKIGAGTLTLVGINNNTYAGATRVNEGTLVLNKYNWLLPPPTLRARIAIPGRLLIGDGSGLDTVRLDYYDQIASSAAVTLQPSGLLDLNGHSQGIGPLTMIGGVLTNTGGFASDGGWLYLWGDVVTSNGVAGTAFPDPQIYGPVHLGNTNRQFDVAAGGMATYFGLRGEVFAGGIVKGGLGVMALQASNSYAGPTLINQGGIYAPDSYSLGATTDGTTVASGATLLVGGGVNLAEPLTLSGIGAWQHGAMELWYGATCSANILLPADANIGCYPVGTTSVISGAISGPGGFTKIGAGTLTLSGSTANSYLGTTAVSEGTLLLNKTFTDGAIPGDLVISANVVLSRYEQIADSADVLINGGGLLDLAGHYEYLDTLRGSGRVEFGTSGHMQVGTAGGSSTFVGVLSGPGYSGGWTLLKAGNGTLTLNGNNTYLNRTEVTGGKLIVNGYQPQSPVRVYSGATLGGSGRVGGIVASGTVSPGASPGTLNCSNIVFVYSGRYVVELMGPDMNADYDQLGAGDTNDLANAELQVIPAFTKPAHLGDRFVIIRLDGREPITGTFANLPEGATVSANGYGFQITYGPPGIGKGVTLTLVQMPSSAAEVAVTAGNGNHAIDPNECNNLAITITNRSGTPMTGISAVLSTTMEGVLVTQPYSSYPNVPAYGKSTNGTPFQISTLSTFPCASNIDLQLTVRSTSHGTFVIPFALHTGEPGVTPLRYDVSGNLAVPDTGTVESTNRVSGFSMPLAKVAVSLLLTHAYDADVSFSLIAPDGRSVLLSAWNGGSGNDYGTACSPDASRTTFDDAAATPITSGLAPFVGTFRPQGNLADFIGAQANGDWRLQITDCCGGSLGTLRCWSLFLYPVTCAAGGGYCDLCLPPITGAITAGSPVQAGRIYRNPSTWPVVASCGAPKVWPGVTSGSYRYALHTFTNISPVDACVTALLTSSGGEVQALAYLGSFDPANIANNYLGDAGWTTAAGPTSFSVNVPAGARFVVTVNEIVGGAGSPAYTLTLSGLPCLSPSLAIAPSQPAGNVRVHWPTWAGGYQLESSPGLTPPVWSPVFVEPIVGGGRYNVTNSVTSQGRFYQLKK